MDNKQNTLDTNQLVIDLKAARQRLDNVRKNAAELEKAKPQAFAEIRRAKNIVSAAQAIVALYTNELAERGVKWV